MYHFSLGIGSIAVIRYFGFEGLDVVVIVILVDVSRDFRLNQFGDLIMDGFVDNSYQI
jgi:hypothetical protein